MGARRPVALARNTDERSDSHEREYLVGENASDLSGTKQVCQCPRLIIHFSMHIRFPAIRIFLFAFVAALALPGAAVAATVQAWLLISGDLKDSVISTDPKEKGTLEKGGWKVSGTGNLQTTPEKGAVALHRLARAGTDATDRLLEADAAKVAAHVKSGFTDEGVLGYVSSTAQPGLIPVHHFTKDGKHFWLIDKADQPAAEAKGWKPAGVSFWLWPVSEKAAPAAKTTK